PRRSAADAGAPLVEARGLTFSHVGRQRPVISDAVLSVARGDRILLEGASGGGKSTLASLVAGLRRPDSGLLLLDGADRATLGAEGWRRRVASAPQFHENHVLTSTLLFN